MQVGNGETERGTRGGTTERARCGARRIERK